MRRQNACKKRERLPPVIIETTPTPLSMPALIYERRASIKEKFDIEQRVRGTLKKEHLREISDLSEQYNDLMLLKSAQCDDLKKKLQELETKKQEELNRSLIQARIDANLATIKKIKKKTKIEKTELKYSRLSSGESVVMTKGKTRLGSSDPSTKSTKSSIVKSKRAGGKT
jgi:vacuolar-type H+-ATPase subunit I/STV1